MKRMILGLLVVAMIVFFTGASAFSTDSVPVQKGDLVVWGYPEVDQEEPGHVTQTYLPHYEAIATKKGIYDPFWGRMRTWDNTDFPLLEHKRYFWGHIEIVPEDSDYSIPEGVRIVILRPTGDFRSAMDIDAMATRYKRLRDEGKIKYNQPFVGIFIMWVKSMPESGEGWVTPDTIKRWSEIYGIDFDALPVPEKFQHMPVFEDNAAYTDIASENFWQRDMNCSSSAAWALIAGYDAATGGGLRNFFFNNLPAVAAVDCIAPGQLAWWLVEYGLFEIVTKRAIPLFAQ